jgi:TnpA family transposase
MIGAATSAAVTKDDIADIINIAIEELVRQRYELPGFSTILKAARKARIVVNNGYHNEIHQALGTTGRTKINALLENRSRATKSTWDRVKMEPKSPTVKHMREFTAHLGWLKEHDLGESSFAGLPDIKLRQFAAEARSLDAASMRDLAMHKKYAIATALIRIQTARAFDDLAEMFVKRMQPDTLHGDTQAQSTPVFALAYLLGIKLMPRIRNWKNLKLFRPDKGVRYKNIDPIFDEVIDWELIETLFPDMLRVAISIKAGHIKAATILRRLGTYSRKNKLYFAFLELGKVVRTIFLLKYISDAELRRKITATTNKCESYNNFTQWVAFGGGGVIAENSRDEQRKVIKYNHLVSSLVIVHTVDSMTKILDKLKIEGHEFSREALASLAPYRTEHINRFGDYTLNLERRPEPLAFSTQVQAVVI